jgi:hypothetical protein
VSFSDESAHRLDTSLITEARQASPSPWPRELGILETQSTPQVALVPTWNRVERRWWDPRPRITITVRARIMGGTRTYRFWLRRSAERRVQDFLDAHRRIYRLYSQPSKIDSTPPLATRSGGL